MLACFVPIIFLVFSGGGEGHNSVWWLLGAGVVMLGMHAFAMRGHGSYGHQGNAGAGVAGNQPVFPSTASQAYPSNQQPVVNSDATKGGHKHGCC